jgi:lauroyl/myristoyl acyltransferase
MNNILNSYCDLHSMHQELGPYGIDPMLTFCRNRYFHHELSINEGNSEYFEFTKLVNFDRVQPGMLYISMHFSRFFMYIPFFLRRSLGSSNSFTILVSKASRESLPNWKKELYRKAETNLGIEFIYAEDPSVLSKLSRRFKEGGTVFYFIDANISSSKKARTVSVPFIYHSIEVNSAIFEIAKKYSISCTPIVATDCPGSSQITVFEGDPAMSPQQMGADIMRKFSQVIMTAPYKWSQWSFLYDTTLQKYSHLIQKPLDLDENFTFILGGKHSFNHSTGVLS